ncbi:MAG: prenyltransferase/squalene oxidase repeat-containing protein [Thermomicrobiales bacterium]
MQRTRWVLPLLIGLALAVLAGPLAPSTIEAQATPSASPASGSRGIAAATGWLISQQGEDGSFLGFSGEPDAGTTVDALLSLAAAKEAGVDVGSAIDDALAYLASSDVALVYTQTGVGQSAKFTLALIAAGQDPADFANVSPLMILDHGLNPETGIYGSGLYDHALSILALVAAGKDVPTEAIDAIAQTQAENGGWAFDGSTDVAAVDSNTTSMVLQALVAAGQGESVAVTKGVGYLESVSTDKGATYDLTEGASPDANSTAVVIQGLLATGNDATALLAALETFQNADGSFFYNAETPGANLIATVQAIPALAKVAFPIQPASAFVVPVLAFTPATFPRAA